MYECSKQTSRTPLITNYPSSAESIIFYSCRMELRGLLIEIHLSLYARTYTYEVRVHSTPTYTHIHPHTPAYTHVHPRTPTCACVYTFVCTRSTARPTARPHTKCFIKQFSASPPRLCRSRRICHINMLRDIRQKVHLQKC